MTQPNKNKTASFNLLSTIFLLVSLIPLLKDGIPKLNNNLRSVIHFNSENIRIFDIIILSWIVLFFVFVMSNLSPQMVDNPFSDISANNASLKSEINGKIVVEALPGSKIVKSEINYSESGNLGKNMEF